MKAIIIGNSGSGKTWLAKRLAEPARIPVVHLDELFWEPGGFDRKRANEEILRLIGRAKQHSSWVAEGVFGELAECFFDEADVLIWLDISWDICRSRLQARGSESKRHMGREQSEEGLRKLVEWASCYHQRTDLRSFDGHRALARRFPGRVIRLQSEQEVLAIARKAQQGCLNDALVDASGAAAEAPWCK